MFLKMISQSLLNADNRHPTSSYSIPLQADIATKDRGSDTAANEGFSPLGMCREINPKKIAAREEERCPHSQWILWKVRHLQKPKKQTQG